MANFSGAGSWVQQAACADHENDAILPLFFARTALERRPARNLCLTSCPVRKDCLIWALEKRQIWGVWGGCDEGELRRALGVDSKGHTLERCRYPHCPYCKARPNRLHVISSCKTDGHLNCWVQCDVCGFEWNANTSVLAVKSYWRHRRKLERTLRAKAPTGRVPNLRRVPMPVLSDPGPTAVTSPGEPPIYPMVASASKS
jgi:WhiB family redox-sensing transcriptional regulator